MSRQRSGFGILTLILTIAIIALLSGIALKAYFGGKTPVQQVQEGTSAIDAARQAQDLVDQGNLRIQEELNK